MDGKCDGAGSARRKKAERSYKRATGIPPPSCFIRQRQAELPSSKDFLLSSYVVREPLIRTCLLLSNRVFPLDFLFHDTAPSAPSINSTLLFSKGGAVSIAPFRFSPEFHPREHSACYFSRDLPPMIYAVRLEFDEATHEQARPCFVVSSDVKTSFSANSMDTDGCLLPLRKNWAKSGFTDYFHSGKSLSPRNWKVLLSIFTITEGHYSVVENHTTVMLQELFSNQTFFSFNINNFYWLPFIGRLEVYSFH